jgi:hypothetical protein
LSGRRGFIARRATQSFQRRLMAKGKKTGGRRAGTPNKATAEGRQFVDRVKRELRKKHKLTLEAVSAELLSPESPLPVRQRELQNLREYLYGRSVQPIAAAEEGSAPLFVFAANGAVERRTR